MEVCILLWRHAEACKVQQTPYAWTDFPASSGVLEIALESVKGIGMLEIKADRREP
jgi:hypothetical protein